MKNSLLKYLTLIFILLTGHSVLGDDLIFNTETINIINNGKNTIAKNGKANFTKENFEITGDKFEYDNEKKVLKVFNATSLLINENVKIQSEKMLYDRLTFELVASDKVRLDNLKDGSKITTEELIYNTQTKKISSNTNSKFIDSFNNSLYTENFSYDLNTSIAKINSLKLIDTKKNEYSLKKGFLNTKTKKLVGKDVFVDLGNAITQESNFRIKSLGIEKNPGQTIMKKAVFTPCKKREDCPPWQLSAETITHDEKKKVMYYKNAWLKIYDKPVLYFPSFFHPDPTVERQSGFLIPSFTSSKNLGNSINIPYFKVISDSRDLTFKPKIFTNNKLLSQAEYRQIGKNYNHEMDFSVLADKGNSSRSHFFSKTTKDLENSIRFFDESDVKIDLQQVSNDSFLKSYKLNSPLINNENTLTSSINFNGYSEDLLFNTELIVYENLSKNDNDRYEYILPSYNLSKQLVTESNFNG